MEPGGRKRITIERTISVARIGTNCFGVNARDVKGNTSRERVCVATRQQPVPGQASAEVRSPPMVPEAKAPPPVTAMPPVRPSRSQQIVDPAPDVSPHRAQPGRKTQTVEAGEKGQPISMEKKIELLKQHYLAERITAKQFDRAVRTLESGTRDRMLEDFISGEISISTFRRAF